MAVARHTSQLKEQAGESSPIVIYPADIGDDASVEVIRERLDGPVRLALMAAGLPVRGSDSIDPAALVLGANIKLAGPVRLLRTVRDHLVRSSRFVTFAGTLGLEPRAHEAGLGAIKAAVFTLMRQNTMLYGPKGVTVHTLALGPADTLRLRRIVTTDAEERGLSFEEVWSEYLAQTSLGRLPTPEEVSWAVMFLLEPEADMFHGGVLHLDAEGQRGIH